jgi:hypothetical protein
MAKEEKTLQCMFERVTGTGRGCGMEVNVGKTKVKSISRQPFPSQIMIDQKELDNVEHFNCLGSMVTNDARYTHAVKSRIIMEKAEFDRKKTLFNSKLDLNLRKQIVKCYNWSITLYGAEMWTLRK